MSVPQPKTGNPTKAKKKSDPDNKCVLFTTAFLRVKGYRQGWGERVQGGGRG